MQVLWECLRRNVCDCFLQACCLCGKAMIHLLGKFSKIWEQKRLSSDFLLMLLKVRPLQNFLTLLLCDNSEVIWASTEQESEELETDLSSLLPQSWMREELNHHVTLNIVDALVKTVYRSQKILNCMDSPLKPMRNHSNLSRWCHGYKTVTQKQTCRS